MDSSADWMRRPVAFRVVAELLVTPQRSAVDDLFDSDGGAHNIDGGAAADDVEQLGVQLWRQFARTSGA
jgi:hypothetical protein